MTSRNLAPLALAGIALLFWLVVIAYPVPADMHGADAAASAEGADADVGAGADAKAGSGVKAEMGRAAQAELRPIGAGDVSGTITFQEQGDLVRVSGVVRGLSTGKHGFHVHEGRSCEDRGGHFAPQDAPHGSPDAQQRHVGDLGNLAVSGDGEAAYLRVDRALALSGPGSIVGRVLVVHQGEDDYLSQPSGDSGEEIACGRIELETGEQRSQRDAPAPTQREGAGTPSG